MTTRDSYNQDHTQYINGHRIDLVRLPEKDTATHAYYRFSFTTKQGEQLFGKAGDTCGIPTLFKGSFASNEATLLAFAAVTMQEQDTDESFFADYTEAELAWSRSYACESLGYEVSDMEERAGLR